ncbi:MAG: Na+/H+ antiporter NhaA [Asgard group archaeon]|nr:Na+/H+ antiporter NhaA [Asgard group archaeon]
MIDKIGVEYIMSERAKKIYRTLKNPPIMRVVSPLQRFIQQEALGSKILLICIVLGLIWANIPWGDTYDFIWNTEFSINFGIFSINKSLLLMINEGLMAIFFFVIGLELKREMLIGGLNNLKEASTSIIAAIGGMIFPAIIFVSINHPKSVGASGWSIPIATDIAIAIGVLSFFSYKIPKRIKLFLTSMAIIDDIGSIFIITIFHSGNLDWRYILAAIAILGILLLFNRLGIIRIAPYIILGIFLWFFVLKSGIHATLAGVVLAALIPATKRIDLCEFYEMSKKSLNTITDLELDPDEVSCYNRVITQVHALEESFRNIQAPIEKIEHKLIGWVALLIVPLFALSNAGINFSEMSGIPFTNRIFWGVFLGLIVGKPLGVFCFTWIAMKMKLFKIGSNFNWLHIIGMSFLMGIGFTMASFLASLSFSDNFELLSISKLAILLGSLFSGIIGYLILRKTTRKVKISTNGSSS